MPLMKGRAPIRRTLDYLNKLDIVLRKDIQVMTINYNVGQKSSAGLYDFQFWHLPQIQYKNPKVQVMKFKNTSPSPYIQFFFKDDKKLLVDVDSQSRNDILQHILNTFCLSEEQLAEREVAQMTENPANFGVHHARTCICEVPGQVPCPGWAKLPRQMTGKYRVEQWRKQQEQKS